MAHSIQTCRWGTPTMFLPWPLWCEAADDLWSCTRGAQPHRVHDPRTCETCSAWVPALPAAGARHDDDDHLGSTAP